VRAHPRGRWSTTQRDADVSHDDAIFGGDGGLVEGFARHRTEPHAERVSAASLHFLADNGRTATNLLSTLAAAEMPYDPTVAVSFAALTNDLLDALGL